MAKTEPCFRFKSRRDAYRRGGLELTARAWTVVKAAELDETRLSRLVEDDGVIVEHSADGESFRPFVQGETEPRTLDQVVDSYLEQLDVMAGHLVSTVESIEAADAAGRPAAIDRLVKGAEDFVAKNMVVLGERIEALRASPSEAEQKAAAKKAADAAKKAASTGKTGEEPPKT